jgi:mono/diheme cytochrome c family protein
MPTRRSAVRLCLLAGLLFGMSWGGGGLPAPPAVHAQAGSARSRQRPAPRPAASAATGTPAARELFRQHCVRCHGAGGTASAAPAQDFTDPRWQEQRSDAQLVVAILEGKGDRMPPFRGKVSEEGADELATLIRTFDPTYDPTAARRNAVSADEFSKRFRLLEAEMERLGAVPEQVPVFRSMTS